MSNTGTAPAGAWSALIVWLCLAAGCGGGSSGPSAPLLSIPPSEAVSDGTTGALYTQTIQATGGVAPFNWSVYSGSLPHNVTLGSTTSNVVTISGMPDVVQAGVMFTIQVADSSSQTARQSFTMDIRGTVAPTQSGAVHGVITNNLVAFRGIPYAAPPVGALRWQPPQPPISWGNTRDASTFGNICPQLNASNQLVGSEDCLFLNIYASSQPAHNQQQPVMVFIHGGNHTSGSTHSPHLIDAPPLATQGVIVVTVEYRLGLLGYLANPLLTAEGGGSSGNYGLRDEIASLAWVRQNIASFGGDPARVAVVGWSAGAADVQALLVSPSAQGTFSAAGMESNARGPGQVPTLAASEANEAPFVHAVGCDTAVDVLACLRAVPAALVVSSLSAVPLFRSVAIEPGVLPVDPFDKLQTDGSPVPLLIGSTSEEESGTTPLEDPATTPPLTDAAYAAAIHAQFDPILVGAGNQVLSLYPVADYTAPVYALIAAETDFSDITTVRAVARAASGSNRPPVWRYIYTHRYERDPALLAAGAFHGAELPFVFGSPQLIFGGPYTPSAAEDDFAVQMMGYWSRFTKTGDPNGPGAYPWPRYDAATDAMLQLDDTPATLKAINGYHNAQCDYFSTLP